MLPRVLASLAALLTAASLAACGGGPEGPATTAPRTATSPARNPTTTAPRPTRPAPPRVATNPPAGSGERPSAPGNDRELTPQERQREFERYCDTHPGACD